MARILITDPNLGINTDSVERVKAPGHEPARGPFPISEEQYPALIGEVEAVVAGPDPMSPRIIEPAKN